MFRVLTGTTIRSGQLRRPARRLARRHDRPPELRPVLLGDAARPAALDGDRAVRPGPPLRRDVADEPLRPRRPRHAHAAAVLRGHRRAHARRRGRQLRRRWPRTSCCSPSASSACPLTGAVLAPGDRPRPCCSSPRSPAFVVLFSGFGQASAIAMKGVTVPVHAADGDPPRCRRTTRDGGARGRPRASTVGALAAHRVSCCCRSSRPSGGPCATTGSRSATRRCSTSAPATCSPRTIRCSDRGPRPR